MDIWIPTESELKFYPHFDQYISPKKISDIVRNPNTVAKNAFFPFMEYIKKTKKFRHTPEVKPKERIIRYACRRDAYIFSYYRRILAKAYEMRLTEYGIEDCPIAYRKIANSTGSLSGKSTINFAYEAFCEISRRNSCFAIALDISKFFESLDHSKLKNLWCDLLNVTMLPSDHEAVFKAITNYRTVDLDQCYERLGYEKKQKSFHLQICNPKIFREKICGGSPNYPSLIKKNKENFGIPQGSPISDLLANIYLLNFDREIFNLMKEINGYYRRYSDDILLICPNDEVIINKLLAFVSTAVERERLQVNKKKTNITRFYLENEVMRYQPYQAENKNSKKSFEYLGFSFNGQKCFIKSATLSRYYRKMTFGVRWEAWNIVARFPGKTLSQIMENINYSKLYKKYGRIENFKYLEPDQYKSWNFWTYAKRSSKIMGTMGSGINYQLSNHDTKLKFLLKTEIANEFYKKRFNRKRFKFKSLLDKKD